MAGLKKPHFYILCNVINYCCTVLKLYTESDSSEWYELFYPAAKNLFSSHSVLPHREGKKQLGVLTRFDFSNRMNSPLCV